VYLALCSPPTISGALLQKEAMNHERLVQLIQAHCEAMETDPEASATHETIVSIFRGLEQGEITVGRAVYLLGYQAVYWADDPGQAARYRQAAAALRQMQRAEQ
jgi:hypothetical protein